MVRNDRLFSWKKIRSRSRVVEYAIYSRFLDGTVDDIEEIIVFTKDEDIEKYVKKKYWKILSYN